MFKILSVLVLSAMMVGCEDSSKTLRPEALPSGLSDCAFYELQVTGRRLNVVRCPNSSTSTTYKVGKATNSTTVVE